MMPRTLAFAAAALVLLVPTAAAHPSGPGEAGPATNHPCSPRSVDFLCWHTDCTLTFCVVMFCVVSIPHQGHATPHGFGCTPP